MKESVHQPLTLPQPLPSLRSIWADVPAETNFVSKENSIHHEKTFSCCGHSFHGWSKSYLRHPEVFLKTVVHSALSSLEGLAESLLPPECGMMISSVRVWSPLLITIIFSGSWEERFHRVPAKERTHMLLRIKEGLPVMDPGRVKNWAVPVTNSLTSMLLDFLISLTKAWMPSQFLIATLLLWSFP